MNIILFLTLILNILLGVNGALSMVKIGKPGQAWLGLHVSFQGAAIHGGPCVEEPGTSHLWGRSDQSCLMEILGKSSVFWKYSLWERF